MCEEMLEEMPEMRWSRRLRDAFIRRMGASTYFEVFFICAITSIVVLRVYLRLTGYPQVGGNGLHISHMLWGGLLMLLTIVLLLGSLSPTSRSIAAVTGSIGFGVFIDELGKFITSDTNYFFRPTFALIYVIFIALYLGLRAIAHWWPYSREERRVNALELVEEAVLHDLDTSKRERAVRYIRQSLGRQQSADVLIGMLDRGLNSEQHSLVDRMRQAAARLYRAVVARPWLLWLAVAVLIVESIAYLAPIAVATVVFSTSHPPEGGTRFYVWGGALSAALVAGVIIFGIFHLRTDPLRAYRALRWAMLVDIFLVQFFAFYWDQLRALIGLIVSILILAVVDYAIAQETQDDHAASPSSPDALGADGERPQVVRPC